MSTNIPTQDDDATGGTVHLRPYAPETRTSLIFGRDPGTDGKGIAALEAHGVYGAHSGAHFSLYTSRADLSFQKRIDVQADVEKANVNLVNVNVVKIGGEQDGEGELHLENTGGTGLTAIQMGRVALIRARRTADNVPQPILAKGADDCIYLGDQFWPSVFLCPFGVPVLQATTAGVRVEGLQLGHHHLWVDLSGRLRIKPSPPLHDADGTVVGAQS